jgi:hypothetical protein
MARKFTYTAKRYSIYCYTCPITNEIFYVGQDHKYGTRGDSIDQHNHGSVQHKLNKLFRFGLKPKITRLFQFDTSNDPTKDLNEAEIFWIAEGWRLGWPLLNCTIGGKVTSGWACYAETRAKISAANKGKKRTPEQRKRNADARRGLRHSEETRQKMSQTRKGRSFSEAHRDALKASWHEHHDAETAEKIAASKRGKPRDAETKKKLSESLKGKPWSEARRNAQLAKRTSTNAASEEAAAVQSSRLGEHVTQRSDQALA